MIISGIGTWITLFASIGIELSTGELMVAGCTCQITFLLYYNNKRMDNVEMSMTNNKSGMEGEKRR